MQVEERTFLEMRAKFLEIGIEIPLGLDPVKGAWGLLYALAESIRQLEKQCDSILPKF